MKTWAQLLLSAPSISSFSFVIATSIKKEGIKSPRKVAGEVKKGEERQSFELIKNKQCDFPQKMLLDETAGSIKCPIVQKH
jgi:hypothetical protein